MFLDLFLYRKGRVRTFFCLLIYFHRHIGSVYIQKIDIRRTVRDLFHKGSLEHQHDLPVGSTGPLGTKTKNSLSETTSRKQLSHFYI